MSTPNTYDVIVLGSGSTGLSAALAATKSGAKVLVLEKSELVGGTSAMSGSATNVSRILKAWRATSISRW